MSAPMANSAAVHGFPRAHTVAGLIEIEHEDTFRTLTPAEAAEAFLRAHGFMPSIVTPPNGPNLAVWGRCRDCQRMLVEPEPEPEEDAAGNVVCTTCWRHESEAADPFKGR